MIPNLTRMRGGGRRSRSRLILMSAGGALMVGVAGYTAWAANDTPAANTTIGNQASATYLDPTGASQLATSNAVQTTVQQVGAFTLDGANTGSVTSSTVQNTKTGAAGATLYAPHILANTGNGSDQFDIAIDPGPIAQFSKIEIYADTDGDGLPDGAALCSVSNPAPGASCAAPSQTVAGNSAFQFVVAYSIPTNATTPLTPYNYGTVSAKVSGSSPVLATYASSQSSNRDNINLTTLAAFNLSKSITAPSVAAPGGGAWFTPKSNGERSSSASCSTTYSAGLTPSASCQYTIYTFKVNNTGGAAGKFVMQDVLPSGFTYVAGSSVWSTKGGTALDEAGNNAATNGGLDYQVNGNTVTAVIQNLAPNTTQSISMVVLVNNTAAVGNTTTTNVASFNPLDASTATAASPGTLGSTTNPSIFQVDPTYGFAIGSTASTAATAQDATPGTPNAGADDNTTVAQAAAGTTVSFTNRVYNTGNAADAIDLTVDGTLFPAGTVFNFYASDGVTPLLNTTGNSNVDTGLIQAGSYVDIVVKATVPASAPVGSGPYTAKVLGTSASAPSLQAPGDATTETLNLVTGGLVDLTNTAAGTGSGSVANGDLGPGPSPMPTLTKTTPAGTGVLFDLYVKNNDSIDTTYNLSASQSSTFPGNLPAGWTVKFVAAGGTCASPAITSVTVTAGTQAQVEACVTPPSNAAATTSSIYFQAQSQSAASTGVIVQDAVTDAVTVTTQVKYLTSLDPAGSEQVAPAGSVVFPHNVNNLGTQDCVGGYTLTATIPAADLAAGWSTPALYLDVDNDGQISAADTLITGPITSTLLAGTTQKVLVKEFAPANVTSGATTITVTATFADAQCGAPTVQDAVNIVTGQIRVTKNQALDANCDGTPDAAFAATALTAKPGECLVYEVVAKNEGVAPVTNLTVNDAVPAFTALSTAQPATQCTSSGVTGTAVAYAAAAGKVSCGSTTNTVAPQGTVTLDFAVKINP